jgi:Uma2 family endonuclease
LPPTEATDVLLKDDARGEWRGAPGERVTVELGRDATLDDLRRVRGKAEIVGGRLVLIGPSGCASARAAGRILVSLATGAAGGRPLPSRVAYVVDLPTRRSFCPDASWWTGAPGGAGFLRGAPAFAAEVRDEGDYGSGMEREMEARRADYFAAGTLVVWDVDVLREGVVRRYRAGEPDEPLVFARGDVADAEPAVPGWRIPVDELFE